jgi:hypothetical protein
LSDFFGPAERFPFEYEVAETFDPFIACGLFAPDIEEIHPSFRIESYDEVDAIVAPVCRDCVV